jgi:hypothetical protein
MTEQELRNYIGYNFNIIDKGRGGTFYRALIDFHEYVQKDFHENLPRGIYTHEGIFLYSSGNKFSFSLLSFNIDEIKIGSIFDHATNRAIRMIFNSEWEPWGHQNLLKFYNIIN